MERIGRDGKSKCLLKLSEKQNGVSGSAFTTSVNVMPMSVNAGVMGVNAGAMSVNVMPMSVVNAPAVNKREKVEVEMKAFDASGKTKVIRENEDLFDIDADVETILFSDNVCNDSGITKWDTSGLKNLKALKIGNNCLQHISSFSLSSLKKLERVEIGNGCFANEGGFFEVEDCKNLKSVSIGDNSCRNWTGIELNSGGGGSE